MKNQVRTPVALEADLRSQNIDICVVSETYLSTEMPHAIVNIPNYVLLSAWVPVSIMDLLYRQDCMAITSGDNHYYGVYLWTKPYSFKYEAMILGCFQDKASIIKYTVAFYWVYVVVCD